MSVTSRFAPIVLPVAVVLGASSIEAASSDVQYTSLPNWILPPPPSAGAPTSVDVPLEVTYLDNQVRISETGEEHFTAYRIRILKPEALPAGNILLTWPSGSGEAKVHYLRIIRDKQVTDVLAANKFRTFQREGGLEQSILDGQLTASLQAPGLQVGDELEFAATVSRREAAFGDRVANFTQLPVTGSKGVFRFRLLWPQRRALTWRATNDLPAVNPTKFGDQSSVAFELRDPSSSIATEGAPARYNIRRLVEYSDFGTWTDVSRQLFPLFEKASHLSANSPIRAEAAKIASTTADPVGRVEAALALVQDRIRYVYVGLDGGNYVPASIDETWQRRFGDCKAKTALLLALLYELGIDAEPVLVSLDGGDGTDARLPNPRLFNHVLVRARIAGRSYWLDGTRRGDRFLSNVPGPPFRWALPLSAKGSDLLRVDPVGPSMPQYIAVAEIDASAGTDVPAKVSMRHVMRGDEAFQIRTTLAAMTADDANRALMTYWRQQADWIEPTEAKWRYDERYGSVVLSVTGDGKLEWEGDKADGQSLDIIGAGFVPPDKLRRPAEQDQSAPWAVEFPKFRCWATSIRLPSSGQKWAWAYKADPVDRTLGGVTYWRSAGLQNNVVRTVMSRQHVSPELSAADAVKLNAEIATFNNRISQVYQTGRAVALIRGDSRSLPFSETTDWVADPSPCSAPAK